MVFPLPKLVSFFPVFLSSKNCTAIHSISQTRNPGVILSPFNLVSFQILPFYLRNCFSSAHFSPPPRHHHSPKCHCLSCRQLRQFLNWPSTHTWFPFQSGRQGDLSKTQTLPFYPCLKLFSDLTKALGWRQYSQQGPAQADWHLDPYAPSCLLLQTSGPAFSPVFCLAPPRRVFALQFPFHFSL